MAWLLPGSESLHMTGILLWVGAIAVLDAKLAALSGCACTLAGFFPLPMLPEWRSRSSRRCSCCENPLFLLKTALVLAAVYITAAMHGRILRSYAAGLRSLGGEMGDGNDGAFPPDAAIALACGSRRRTIDCLFLDVEEL